MKNIGSKVSFSRYCLIVNVERSLRTRLRYLAASITILNKLQILLLQIDRFYQGQKTKQFLAAAQFDSGYGNVLSFRHLGYMRIGEVSQVVSTNSHNTMIAPIS